MARYTVYLTGYASASLTVEAEDEEAAVEEALSQGVPGICAQCSGYGQDWSLEVGDEWDRKEPEVVPADEGVGW